MTVVVADDMSSVKDLTSRHSMIRLLAHHSSGCTRKCGVAIVTIVVFADMIWFFLSFCNPSSRHPSKVSHGSRIRCFVRSSL
jgi:hypothetical protein